MNKRELKICSNAPEETLQLGCKLAGFLDAGDVISLKGELGSGKTLFTQGIGLGLHVQDSVTSPSFTLVQEYRADIPVYHFDFYRLNSISDVEDLDFDGYLEGQGIVIIEWADKGGMLIPEYSIDVTFERIYTDHKIVEGKRALSISYPEDRDLSGVTA